MLLTFSKEEFKEKILNGTKTTTLRVDSRLRWKKGMKAHLWLGNPRNTRSKPKPHAFGLATIEHIDSLIITKGGNMIKNNMLLSRDLADVIAENDGFKDFKEMKAYFGNKSFHGRLLYLSKVTTLEQNL